MQIPRRGKKGFFLGGGGVVVFMEELGEVPRSFSCWGFKGDMRFRVH